MRHTLASRQTQIKSYGLDMWIERTSESGHRYCLVYNSPSGSKEWLLCNLQEECDVSISEALQIAKGECDLPKTTERDLL